MRHTIIAPLVSVLILCFSFAIMAQSKTLRYDIGTLELADVWVDPVAGDGEDDGAVHGERSRKRIPYNGD